MDEKDNEKKVFNGEIGEDATQYGEWMSTYFAWTTLRGQKEKAKQLENMTKKDITKKNE